MEETTRNAIAAGDTGGATALEELREFLAENGFDLVAGEGGAESLTIRARKCGDPKT